MFGAWRPNTYSLKYSGCRERNALKVAQALLNSLEEPEEAVSAAWAAELERRSRDVADGRVRPLPWESVRDEIASELEQRRARRASS